MNRPAIRLTIQLILTLFLCVNCTDSSTRQSIELWLSKADGNVKFQKQSDKLVFTATDYASEKLFKIDPSISYQKSKIK